YETAISQLSQNRSKLEHAVEVAKFTLSDTEQKRKSELELKELELIIEQSELQKRASQLQKEKEYLELEKQSLQEERNSYKTDIDLKNQFTQHSIENSRKEIEDSLSIERQRLDSDWEDLQEAKNNLDGLVDDAMEQERTSHTKELVRLNQKLDKAWDKVDELKSRLEGFRELESSLGEQSAEEFIGQLNNLKQENRDLRRKHSEFDSSALEEQNENLRSRVNSLDKELDQLRPELNQAREEAAHKRVAATELMAKEQERRVLDQHKNVLSVHIDDLESRIDQLTNAQKTQTPFPAMSLMDSDKVYRSTIEQEDVPDLSQFADELQHRIAQAEEKVQLYYPIEDIRVLLGGLAMSQLHVFQGISGTGKTSLAKAFAKAVGGFCTDVAVQAGWRDRDDLLGHYNAFERRFYEKDSLQALYQAQTPRWQDACNVILLDEMNLSRPEQYFAEFLSALEKNNPNERLISLSETTLPNAPAMLRSGRQLLVPANVWFIGTANHDETTNELADKTYDRAHIMTLPKQDHRFDIRSLSRASYSFSSLQKAFEKACVTREAEVSSLLNKMTASDFNKLLGSQFDLGWGNRFEKQALRFIPVMLETGASSGQALDHLLSTRVMRKGKVTGRYDVLADDLRKLQESLENFWIDASLGGTPDKSIDLLESDIRRMEGGV
uniref:AAA family ATPase n=3 Tax=Oceanospirillaceae TaxID=135620 RepID=UPI0035152B77